MIRTLNNDTFPGVVSVVSGLCGGEVMSYALFDYDHFCKVWQGFLLGGIAACFGYYVGGAPVGFICGLVGVQDPITAERQALEMFWIVAPKYRHTGAGIKLLRAFERAAKSAGVKRIICGSLFTSDMEKMRKLYDRLGYRLHAEAFSKQV